MAELISTPLTWSQEDVQKYFLEPLFVSNNSLKHMDVITDVSGSSILLDRYSALKDITKPHALTAFSADGTQSTNSNITLSLDRLEVEHKQASFTMFNHIKSQLLKKGIARNDVSGTIIQEIVSKLLLDGINRDFSSMLWWGDKTNGGGTPYNNTNGVFQAAGVQRDAGTAIGAQVTTGGTTALDSLELMVAARSEDLAAVENVIWCSRAFAESYKAALRAADSHVDAYADLQKGFPSLAFDGIPIMVMPEWDVDVTANGAAMNNMIGGVGPNAVTETKCAFLTMPGNITVGTDFASNPVDMWYNRDEKENRFRMTYSFGCQIKEPLMWVSNTED